MPEDVAKKAEEIEVLEERQTDRVVQVGKERYAVSEMDDDGLAQWMTLQYKAFGGGSTTNGDGRLPTNADLIALCLKKDGKLVGRDYVKSRFGAKTLQRLFQICRDHNGLGAADREAKEKKD